MRARPLAEWGWEEPWQGTPPLFGGHSCPGWRPQWTPGGGRVKPEHRVPTRPRSSSAWGETGATCSPSWASGCGWPLPALLLTPATPLRVHHNQIHLKQGQNTNSIERSGDAGWTRCPREHSDPSLPGGGNLKLGRNRIFAELPTQLCGEKTLKVVGCGFICRRCWEHGEQGGGGGRSPARPWLSRPRC